MSFAKRTGKSSGKAPSTTPPVSPSSMSPTDLRALAQALSDQVQTLTAELQTAQDAQDQAASLHTAQLQTLRTQIHDQAMEIQGWEHRAASRSQDLRLLLADQAVEIRDLTGRLDRASRQRDVMRDDNDHLLREMALAGSEIHQLQSQIHDLERDLEDSQTARAAADVSLDRLRDELRLNQEEVVTNDYVGSAHDGSALGSARGGSPAPNPPPSSPDELQDTKESLERASAGRDYALEEFVRMTRLRDEIQTKLADSELQRDKAATEWAAAKRAQTELESKLRRTSDKLKEAYATAAKLRDQLAAAQTQQQQLVLERDRGLSERDLARRRLALVTAAVSDPLPPLSGPSQAASVSAPLSEKALYHNRLLYVVGAAQQRSRRASPAPTTVFSPSRHISPAKRTGKSSGKAPSTTPPVSETLTAELQTAQDAQDQAASLHTAQLQTLRTQIHDQAMEIQGWEHRAASRSQDLRLLLADQAVEIRDLTGRLDRASRQRDVMRDDNDHLLRETALAGSEIHQLQSQIHDLERDLEDSQTAMAAADVSLDRLRDELRLTQEEVVTNDYVGFAHDGSALGSARGGSPDAALAQLSEELQDTKESLERASAGRDYALEEFVRMTRLRDEIQAKLADSGLQRDKATTEWADAERTQTELESKLRRMSDKLKKADATTAKLQDQLSAAQTQQQQLILERDRGLSERDLARRRLALVTAAVSDPLPPLSGPSQAASVSAPLPTVSGADSSTAKRPRSTSPAPSTGSSRPHKQARASPKAKPKTTPVSKSAPQAGSTSVSKAGSTPAPKTSVSPSKSDAGSKSGSTARSKSTSASKTGSAATSKAGVGSKAGSTAATSKSGSGPKTGSTASKTGSVASSKTGSAVSKTRSTAKTGSTSKTGSTAGPSVTTPAVPRPASIGHPPARAGPGKGKAKRVIPPGCGLGSSEDDEGEESDWSDGSGPPNRSSSKHTSSSGPYPFTVSDGGDDDDDDDDGSPEDSEEAQAAEDALEEDTRRALSQSRSEARRRSLSTPPPQVAGTAGSGGDTAGSAIQVDSDGGSGSDGGRGSPRGDGLLGSGGGGSPGGRSPGSGGGGSPHGGGSPGSPHGGGSPGSSHGMLPVAPFGPDAAFIPGRRAPVAFATRDIESWSAKKLNRVAVISMKITVLFPELPFRAEWIFPRTADAIPRAGSVDSLITRPLVEELTSAAPWDTLVTTPVDPVSFRGDVRGRLGVFDRAFRDFASKHRVAIWEGTHRFPISRSQLQGSTWLSNFNKQRGNRRSHAGRAWKRVLVILVLAIQDGWCDVDILLDPSFLHLPRRGDKVAWFPGSVSCQANLEDPNLHRPEPTSLLEALREIDEAEPWRIRFRGDLSQHPGRQIQRLVGKFFNVQPKTT
ncbi:hypothetical protein GN958_ATG13079 [Phytophthora infestans]|uniref:Uncharacterized protein n=1 Tax=Phytophthora infestans TaxID=4787 RepID=A0A8S9UB69_PHYIN|nr:hypothetical protein GN958_ATG13079 [Phytophthora infestans]